MTTERRIYETVRYLFFVEGKSRTEISRATGIPSSTIYGYTQSPTRVNKTTGQLERNPRFRSQRRSISSGGSSGSGVRASRGIRGTTQVRNYENARRRQLRNARERSVQSGVSNAVDITPAFNQVVWDEEEGGMLDIESDSLAGRRIRFAVTRPDVPIVFVRVEFRIVFSNGRSEMAGNSFSWIERYGEQLQDFFIPLQTLMEDYLDSLDQSEKIATAEVLQADVIRGAGL